MELIEVFELICDNHPRLAHKLRIAVESAFDFWKPQAMVLLESCFLSRTCSLVEFGSKDLLLDLLL